MSERTRKDQIANFQRRLLREWRRLGIVLPRTARRMLADELRGAAMLGACEERTRTLAILNDEAVREKIIAKSVLAVLGYEDAA